MRRLFVTTLSALAFAIICLASANASPGDVIQAYHASLLDISSRSIARAERFKALEPAMDSAFDFEGMIKTATASHWRKSDESQREAVLRAFRRVSIATYANQFVELADGAFDITATRDGPRGLKLVESYLSTGSEKVQITYVMREKDESWRIIDVLLAGGISELAVRASEYASILKDGGMTGLESALNKQADQLLSR